MDMFILLVVGAVIGGVAASLLIKSREQMLEKENAKLRKQIEDLLNGDILPPEVQEKVNAIFAQSKKNTEALSKGISDNQPKKRSLILKYKKYNYANLR